MTDAGRALDNLLAIAKEVLIQGAAGRELYVIAQHVTSPRILTPPKLQGLRSVCVVDSPVCLNVHHPLG
jgi:hypothetical protein